MPWIVQGWIIVTSISHPARAFNLCKTPLFAFLTNASWCKNIPHILYSFLWLLAQFGFSFKILLFGFRAINDSFGQDSNPAWVQQVTAANRLVKSQDWGTNYGVISLLQLTLHNFGTGYTLTFALSPTSKSIYLKWLSIHSTAVRFSFCFYGTFSVFAVVYIFVVVILWCKTTLDTCWLLQRDT